MYNHNGEIVDVSWCHMVGQADWFVTIIFSSRVKVSIPFTKESPFFRSFKAALAQLDQEGHMHTIELKYSLDEKESIRCDPLFVSDIALSCSFSACLLHSFFQTRLGYPQTFFPFAALILGVLLSWLALVFEGALKKCWNSEQNEETLSKWQQEQLIAMIAQKLNTNGNRMSVPRLRQIYQSF